MKRINKYLYIAIFTIILSCFTVGLTVTDVNAAVVKPAKVTSVKATNKTKQDKGEVTVTYKKSQNATAYQIVVATNSRFTSNVKRVITKSTTKTISNLKPNKKYYVKVRCYITVNGKRYYGAYSNKGVFYTYRTASRITSVKAVNKTTQNSASARISFNKAKKYATAYEISLSTDYNFKKNVVKVRTKATAKTVTGLKANKKYYVRVRGYRTVNGKRYYGAYSYKNVVYTSKPISTVSSVAITNKTIENNGSVRVSYNKAINATNYEIVLATDVNFTKNVKKVKTTATAKTITGLKAETKYYVKVRGYRVISDKYFYGNYSNINTINTFAIPDVPDFKTHNIAIGAFAIKFNRGEYDSGYQIRWCTGGELVNYKTETITTDMFEKYELGLNTNISFQVRAYREVDGIKYYGPWSYDKVKTLTDTTPTNITSEGLLYFEDTVNLPDESEDPALLKAVKVYLTQMNIDNSNSEYCSMINYSLFGDTDAYYLPDSETHKPTPAYDPSLFNKPDLSFFLNEDGSINEEQWKNFRTVYHYIRNTENNVGVNYTKDYFNTKIPLDTMRELFTVVKRLYSWNTPNSLAIVDFNPYEDDGSHAGYIQFYNNENIIKKEERFNAMMNILDEYNITTETKQTDAILAIHQYIAKERHATDAVQAGEEYDTTLCDENGISYIWDMQLHRPGGACNTMSTVCKILYEACGIDAYKCHGNHLFYGYEIDAETGNKVQIVWEGEDHVLNAFIINGQLYFADAQNSNGVIETYNELCVDGLLEYQGMLSGTLFKIDGYSK